MALAHPNRAIDVWNTMVKNGIRPDSAAWTAMLSGARVARDLKALDQIWTQMCATKIELTKDAWTARVCGLIECRMIGRGLQALDDMGRIWLTEAKARYPKLSQDELVHLEESMVKGVTKPSIETINVAVNVLMRQGKKDAASRVLAWASRFGIAPSAFTYNMLLRPLIRSGDRKAAMNLVKEMEAAGVPPDAGTFVAVIDDALRGAENYTIEEQQSIVASIFEEMTSLGLAVSKGLYGHIIRVHRAVKISL
jgi:pentatricopeptide repeat protein